MPFRQRNVRHILILLLGGGVLAVVYISLASYIEHAIEEKLVSANGKSSSISVNLLTRSLHFKDFEIFPSQEFPVSLRIKHVNLRGVHLYALLVNKKLVITSIEGDSGYLLYHKSKTMEKVQPHSPPRKLETVTVQHLSFINLVNKVTADTVVTFSSVVNCQANGVKFEIDSGKLIYEISTLEGSVKEINFTQQEAMYRVTIDQVRYSSKQQKITLDSLLLIPVYDKFEFAHQKEEQVGRINLSVPQLTIEGISLDEIIDTAFTASKIEINSFDLYSFKDKRIPFLRTKHIPLPMESFQELEYSITVDSLIVRESRVRLEEISENGAEIGVATIDHINAACGLITNRHQKETPPYTVLKASGVLMGEGKINAVFSLPLDDSPTYLTTGSITDFPFTKLNPAIEGLRVRIESGHINEMKFDFYFTDFQSIGTMELDYQDLRIIGLKKNKDGASDFKTAIINAVLKNNKDGTSPRAKRAGTINIERDRRKYIFNIWWKSILDGLRSAILGADKVQHQRK